MAYVPIDNTEIAVGKPAKQGLWQKVKDNFDHLFGLSNPGGLRNGSFELDTDADGIPDGWTRYLYPGGSAGFETTSPEHGSKSYYFTHPGGAGNGGGYIESDYLECSALEPDAAKFTMRSSATGLKNVIEVRWFDKSKVYLSTTTLYSATSTGTSAALYAYNFTPPSNARHYKLRLTGGHTDASTAGTTYFDGVTRDYVVNGSITTAKLKLAQGSWSTAVDGTFDVSIARYSHCPRIRGIGTGAEPDVTVEVESAGRLFVYLSDVTADRLKVMVTGGSTANPKAVVYWDYHTN